MQDKVNYISPETFEKIINYVPVLGIRKWKNEDIKMLYKTMYYCALRANEAINLKKESFNLVDREIYLGKTKTKKQDTAHIPHIFVNELTLWLSTKEQGRLFDGLTYPRVYVWCKRIGTDFVIENFILNPYLRKKTFDLHLYTKQIRGQWDRP